MPAYKIYKSGDNFEVYEYEYLTPEEDFDSSGYDLEKVLDNIDFPETEDRKKERRLQTLRENAMNLKRMAREYFQGKNFFVTLTFKENLEDIDKADRKLKYFIKKLREDFGKVSFVGVREKQKRGAIHYHLLLKNLKMRTIYEREIPAAKRVKGRIVTSEEQKEFERYLHKNYWKHGFVNCTMIDFVDDVGAYLAKYMAKGKIEDMAWLEERRLVLRSQDIKKIEPLDVNEDSEVYLSIINQMEYIKSIANEDIENNLTRKRVFTNGYKSKYAGNTMYYDIHMNRLASVENAVVASVQDA